MFDYESTWAADHSMARRTCWTVRQVGAEERWDKEFVLSIKGTEVSRR